MLQTWCSSEKLELYRPQIKMRWSCIKLQDNSARWINNLREKIDLNRNEIVLRENDNSQSQIYIVVQENLILIVENMF